MRISDWSSDVCSSDLLSTPTREKCAHCQPLHKRGSDEEAGSCAGVAPCRMRSEFPDQAEGGRCECIGTLCDRNDEGDHTRHVVRDEFDLSNERRQPRSVAEPDTAQDETEEQQRDDLACSDDKQDRADN